MTKLTGQALLDYCAEHYEDSKTNLVRGAGYIKDNGKTNYIEFYTAKMQALGTFKVPQPILDDEPKEHGAYIECLESDDGRWIDLDVVTTVEEIESAIETILHGSVDYTVTNWTGIPSFLTSEKPDWSTIVEYLDTKENNDKDAYQAICEDYRQVLTEEEFSDIYRGNYSTEAEFAKNIEKSIGEDSHLHNYVNWQDLWEGEYKSEYVSIKHSKGYYIFNYL